MSGGKYILKVCERIFVQSFFCYSSQSVLCLFSLSFSLLSRSKARIPLTQVYFCSKAGYVVLPPLRCALHPHDLLFRPITTSQTLPPLQLVSPTRMHFNHGRNSNLNLLILFFAVPFCFLMQFQYFLITIAMTTPPVSNQFLLLSILILFVVSRCCFYLLVVVALMQIYLHSFFFFFSVLYYGGTALLIPRQKYQYKLL